MSETEKAIQIGKKVFQESDLEFTVDYEGEVFTMKHPAPYQVAIIEAEIARRLGGFTRASFPPNHLNNIEATAYANELVITEKSPNWWKGAWSCYDEVLIARLFEGYLQFRIKLQERIRGDGPEESS